MKDKIGLGLLLMLLVVLFFGVIFLLVLSLTEKNSPTILSYANQAKQNTASAISQEEAAVSEIANEEQKIGQETNKISENRAREIASSLFKGTIISVTAKKFVGIDIYEVVAESEFEEARILINMLTGKLEGILINTIEEERESSRIFTESAENSDEDNNNIQDQQQDSQEQEIVFNKGRSESDRVAYSSYAASS